MCSSVPTAAKPLTSDDSPAIVGHGRDHAERAVVLKQRSQSCGQLKGMFGLPVREEVRCARAKGVLGWAHACHPAWYQILSNREQLNRSAGWNGM